MNPRATSADELLGKKGTCIISYAGELRLVIAGWIYTDRQLNELGLKIVGAGFAPRKVIPLDQAWTPAEDLDAKPSTG